MNPSALSRPTIKNGRLVYVKEPIQRSRHLGRCVAVGNDEIFIKDKNLFLHPHEGNIFTKKYFSKYTIVTVNNKFFVKNPYEKNNNGIFHDENITKATTSENFGRFDFNLTKVPIGTFFAMGDNREHSYDSRKYGSVSQQDILGKVILLKFQSSSINLFGVLPAIDSLCKPPLQKKHIYHFMNSF